MSLILQSSGGGQITVQEPATASNFTQTLPAATGTVMVSGNQPAFSATKSTNQTITSATWTKISFQTEEFDTASAYDNATNYRFTPQVAGYYQVNCELDIFNLTGLSIVALYKNGSEFKRGSGSASSGTEFYPTLSAIVYLNGSTDYIETYAYAVGVTPAVAGAGSAVYSYFQAVMVRAA